ncbi:hypothetical protein ACF1GT_15815 [Streptomyces sp. NPDC014636]|uniref:hypothetical protein n=1 Tax=Streptomyces sp. NPDC014636 TaxID=3364876 RepID=UPI0036F5BE07
MSRLQILSLLLALSTASNIGFAAGVLTHRTGTGVPQAILAGAAAAATALAIYFAAVAAYA